MKIKTPVIAAALWLAAACNPMELGSPKYRVTVEGTLNDVATAQSTHDAWANAQDPMLPHHLTFAGLLSPASGTVDPAGFIAIDTWDDEAAMNAFYASQSTKDLLGDLLAPGYSVLKWQHPADFEEWGGVDLTAVQRNPVFLFRIRGRYKAADLDETRKTHNRVAGGESEFLALSLSDVTHAVNAGMTDPHEALFIDFWQDPQRAGQFFTSDATISGGLEVFASPGPQPEIFLPARPWAQW